MIQKPRGTQDIFKTEAQEYANLENSLFQIFQTYNFSEIRTPIFEAKDLFVRSVGESTDVVSKEMYEFIDKKGRNFVLRPEGTAPIVRAIIENKLYAPDNLPFKCYYSGPMFRYERPQLGRSRQFAQIGIEVFGPSSVYQDLEVVALINSIVQEFNLQDRVELKINFLVIGSQRKKYIQELKEYLQTFSNLCEDCKERIKKNPLRVLDCKIDGPKFKNVPKMEHFLSLEDEQYFSQLQNGLNELGFQWKLDSSLVRGLDYYTGLVFELKYLDKLLGAQSTIIAGGRYNNLVSELGNIDLPAIGFAIGVERLMLAIKANYLLYKDEGIDLYTIALGKKAQLLNQKLIFELRNAGLVVETDYFERKIKSAFKQAEKLKAKNIVILGDEQATSEHVVLKNQLSKKEFKIAIKELKQKLLKEKK